jgi:hypothetical protein
MGCYRVPATTSMKVAQALNRWLFFFFFFFFSFSNIEKAEGWAQGIKREITSNQKSSSEKELMGMFHDKVMKLSI